MRRVEAAICAFGGSLRPQKQDQQTTSIFRVKQDVGEARRRYDRELVNRYCVSGSRLSWEVEENPPVMATSERSSYKVPKNQSSNDADDDATSETHLTPSRSSQGNTHSDETTEEGASPGSSLTDSKLDAAKSKYKCKWCGQLKQNHNCPYRPSLQRSIGVMVYPAVNSFTAAEPGRIAPPLTKMNNFVSYDSDSHDPDHASHPSYEQISLAAGYHPSTVVTPPEALRSTGSCFQSPRSPLSGQSEDSNQAYPAVGEKRTHHAMINECGGCLNRSPFVASVTLRPEHYRAVTLAEGSTSFTYPAIPLTFVERKRLSDTLFCLCREIPSMTHDCAVVLRAARENGEWDLAVAELLTQVIIGMYCGEGDTRLDGLQRYLLGLGISC
jgi:hypothetical protein